MRGIRFQTAWVNEVNWVALGVRITIEALGIDNPHRSAIRIRTGPPATQVLILAPPGMIQPRRIITLRQTVLLPIRVRCAIALSTRAQADAREQLFAKRQIIMTGNDCAETSIVAHHAESR